MRHLAFDLRDALRTLRRDRGYAATSILTLALTLGATTAVFSIVDGVLLKPLAYRESHRLVAIQEVWREFRDRYPVLPVNTRHFEYWRQHGAQFESLAQYISLPANLTGRGEATQVNVVRTSGTLFDVLQVRAAMGRALRPADEQKDQPNVAAVTDSLWRHRLGSDPHIIGQVLVLDGETYTVVGVLAPGIKLPEGRQLASDVDVFVPMRLDARDGWVGEHNNLALGRLKSGVTLEQARAELNVLQRQVSALASKEANQPVTLAVEITPLMESVVGQSRRMLLLLLAAIAAVLLIACSNLANLALTRTLGQLRDVSIRTALGATRGRLLTRLVLEQLVLAVAGGATGLLIARVAIFVFVSTAPIDLPRAAEVSLDGRVLAFTLVLTVLTGLLVALIPAWHLAGANIQERLRATSLAMTETRGGQRARSTLLALQVALSVTLLIVTGLLTASFVRLARSDYGFNADRALAVKLVLPQSRYPEASDRARLAERVLERVGAVPGVRVAAMAHLLPLAGQGTVNFIIREGDTRPISEQPPANYRYVSSEFFKTLSIPLERGRTFEDVDRKAAAVPAVVTQTTAARIWPQGDAIGRRFRWNPDPSGDLVEVVGVAADTRTDIDQPAPLMVYMPYWYRPRPTPSLVVRTAGDPATVTGAVRQAIRSIDSEIAIASVRPMGEIVDAALSGRRYQVRLFVAFGAIALLIATIGVYAVTAYGVSRRRREMNIRVALGAPVASVVGLVMRQGLISLTSGAIAGLAGALAASRAVGSLLYDVRSRDPFIITLVILVVGAVGLAAASIAARRGLSIDPAAALREE
jgi:putative ABC transport system permease protein